MNKCLFVPLLVCAVFISGCSGCARLAGNDRSNARFCEFTEYGGDGYLCLDGDEYLKRDGTTGDFTLYAYGDVNAPYSPDKSYEGEIEYPVVLRGNDFPRYETQTYTGYEELPTLLCERYETGNISQIQYYALAGPDGAFGFCNLYYKAIGYLSGGGNIGVEEIAYAITFSYSPGGELTETNKYSRCNIVAYNGNSAIYYRDKNYYCDNGEEEIFICNDKAYDGGIAHYSHAYFIFDYDLTVLRFRKRYSDTSKDYNYTVICDFGGNILFERETRIS